MSASDDLGEEKSNTQYSCAEYESRNSLDGHFHDVLGHMNKLAESYGLPDDLLIEDGKDPMKQVDKLFHTCILRVDNLLEKYKA